MCIAYGILSVVALLFALIVGAAIYATAYDFWYARKYRTWVELQKDHTKPRKPAAK